MISRIIYYAKFSYIGGKHTRLKVLILSVLYLMFPLITVFDAYPLISGYMADDSIYKSIVFIPRNREKLNELQILL